MSGRERKFTEIADDGDEVILSGTKKLRIGSDVIDSHWKNVPTTPRSPDPVQMGTGGSVGTSSNTNHQLPFANALLKELHFYRQARRASEGLSEPGTNPPSSAPAQNGQMLASYSTTASSGIAASSAPCAPASGSSGCSNGEQTVRMDDL